MTLVDINIPGNNRRTEIAFVYFLHNKSSESIWWSQAFYVDGLP